MAQVASAKCAETREVSINCVMLKPLTRGSSPKCTTCVSPYRFILIRSHKRRANSRIASASCMILRSQSYRSMQEESPQYCVVLSIRYHYPFFEWTVEFVSLYGQCLVCK